MSITRGMILCTLWLAAPAYADQGPPPDTHVAAAGSGPAATLGEACMLDASDPDATRCKKQKLEKKLKAVEPYTGFGLMQRRYSGTRAELFGIQTAAGWYVFPLLEWGTDYDGKGSVAIASATIKDVVPGGAPEVVLRLKRKTSNEASDYSRYGETVEVLWVCSVGGTGAPSCAEVVLAMDVTPNTVSFEDDTRFKLRLAHRFEADGRLTRKVKGKWPKKAVMMGETLDRGAFENSWGFAFR